MDDDRQTTFKACIVQGGVAGLTATVAMSALLLGARAAGLLGKPPPKQITERFGERIGIRPQKAPEPVFRTMWLAAHAGYGTGAGIVYSFARLRLPGPPALVGLEYGLGLWGVSYLGVMPALGLYPWPEEDSNTRTAVMIAAHAVYGISLAEAEEHLRRS